ncbi:MAG: hypothetical protein IJP09_02360 [Clostridia bacterium]|nr:hypothetical protein [Clostridia bacterium]
MAFYQKIIKSDSNANTNAAMESWASNLVDFINESTSIGATYSVTSKATNQTAWVLNLPISGSKITRFGVIMNTNSSTTDHMGCFIFNSGTYGYDVQGNFFDYTEYYAKRVLILHNENSFYLLVEKNDSSFTTLVALNKVTEVATGNEYWASRGFVPTSSSAYTLNNLTTDRSNGAASGGVTNDISIANAFTEDGRYMVNNLYAFHAPATTTLPKFMKFAVEDENGDLRYAIILGSTTVKSNSTLYGAGEFLMFID